MKKLLIFIAVFPSLSWAVDVPKFKYKDPTLQQEFENIGQEIQKARLLPTAVSSSSYIQNTNSLQSGATAYPAFLYVGSTSTIPIVEVTSETVSGRLFLPSGSAASPSLTFSAQAGHNMGMYRVGANYLGFATAGSFAFGTASGRIFANDGTESTPAYSFDSDSDIGMYRAGANDLRWSIPSSGNFNFVANSQVVLRFEQSSKTWWPDTTTKTVDLGVPAQAFDDMYADDFNNVADIPFFDYVKHDGEILSVNDLDVVKNIQPLRDKDGNLMFTEKGYAYWDDNTLPEWVFHRNEKGEIVRDADGKPWISMKVLAGMSLGAVGQLSKQVDELKARIETLESENKKLKGK